MPHECIDRDEKKIVQINRIEIKDEKYLAKIHYLCPPKRLF